MKFPELSKSLLAPALIVGAVAVAALVPQAKAHLTSHDSYSAVVCPGALGGSSERITLPAKNLPLRAVNGTSATLKPQKAMSIVGVHSPIFISGNPGSEVAFESISGSSTADTACEVGGADQWFIGGSAGVTSQSVLEIINSGLSDSVVQIYPFNSKISLAPISLTIKANSDQQVKLASIVPGDESVALHIVTESGRVTSFLLDHRKSGLKDLGSSFVTPVESAATTSFISGLYGSSGKAVSMMRFLVPGNINAAVHLTVFSQDGTFTPVGFDSLAVTHQRIVDIALPKFAFSGPYGIEINSDQPILAATLTRTSAASGDFAWANQLTPISRFRVNLGGVGGEFFFIGKSVALNAQWSDAKGKSQSILISGESSALWSPIGPLGLVTFTPLTKEAMYGGAILSNGTGGLNYLPLLANALVSGAQLPTPDIRTLARH